MVDDTNINGWYCTCGRKNAHFVGTCGCGKSRYVNFEKQNVVPSLKVEITNGEQKNNHISSADKLELASARADALLKYKILVDQNAITLEEYENFKKSIISGDEIHGSLENVIELECNSSLEETIIKEWVCPNCQHTNNEEKRVAIIVDI